MTAAAAAILSPSVKFDLEQVRAFLYREARLLDDRQWDEWIKLYSPDVDFWMPSWDDDDQLVTDPQTEISLIWYGHKGGLEDRVFRIKTERSGASTPEPRTSHNISNIEIVEERDGELDLRFNWHTLSHRYKKTDDFFGTAFYTLDTKGDEPRIVAKKVVLKSDYIHQVIDIYHI
jgi:benzoate/toluate 1,2-dioxygenase beta subunit